ncbi:RDD family protein [[Eubacterium] hominis]|uniref:RDD family protein n=1 Tax=[Eubacterium] hominis TaxID=2764325 RepID=UPI003A4E05B0
MISIPLQRKESPVSLTSASHIRRFIAFAIDWYLGSILVSLPVSMAYYQFFPQQNTILDLRTLPFSTACMTLLASLLIACLYYIVLPYRLHGQTIGKKIMKLRIKEKGKQEVTLKTLVLRQLIAIILIEGSVYTISPLIYQIICYGSDSMLEMITTLHYILTIVSIACCLFTKRRCAIHDFIAKTTVESV